MTEEEIKSFFNVNANNEKTYLAVRNNFSDEEIIEKYSDVADMLIKMQDVVKIYYQN